ncbi:S8 family serine peptidase, partial [Candidatus Saccharibacteria bacterium]|nr:S8 family serine peptidase [Candidatus Saccharibacteria bacterium]
PINKDVTYPYRSEVKKEVDKIISKTGATYPLRVYRTLLTPNDTYASQWWVGSTNLEQAWDIPAGAKQTTIAVIDTGFALNHQEFNGRWATNSEESGSTALENPSKLNCDDQSLPLNRSCNNIDDNFDGIVDNESGATIRQNPSWLNCSDRSIALDKSCNRTDDDGNGLVDDWRGWDFSNFDQSPQAGETNPDGSGTRHGTMVAGVLGATGNNNVGIAGVNWQTKILPLQALDDDGYGDSYTVGNAIYYAADQGVDLISVSLGTDFEDPYLREAVLYAQSKGILIVASAGNDGCDCMVYPANYPEVLAVGASQPSGGVASFSSFGPNLDIIAPGQDMTTSYWSKTNQTSAYASGAAGTSFSAPFVSGVLGLLRSHQPDASWDEVIGILLENSDRKTLTVSTPRSNSLGFGFIKTDQALSRSTNPYSLPINYKFAGDVLGTEGIRKCEGSLIPGSFLYELTKSGQVKYTINQYEIRKKVNAGWSLKKLFGVCVSLPTDTPDVLRSISLTQEIRNQLLKQ